jgi:protease IV
MNSFLKSFLASLLALFLFTILLFFIAMGFVSGLAVRDKEETGAKAVLVVDLAVPYPEIRTENTLAALAGGEHYDIPSLYDVVRMIKHAKGDSAVKGIFIKCGNNMNGFANSDEIRNAIVDFKSSGKFVIAYADVITQGGYYVGNCADKLYCNPRGGVDWRGYAVQLAFLKGLLEKLEIEPQIFYAGQYKSATEPFRETKMTEPNRLQLKELLNDLYGYFLTHTANARKIDTATLHRLANEQKIQFASDALKYGLVDGLKYNDEVQDEIKARLNVGKYDKINFVSLGKYSLAAPFRKKGREKIAVIYAQGDIVDGKGDKDMIGGDTYRGLLRKARLDKDIKAIVVRINSGGGSSLASENIWREMSLAKQEKPVVVSFGDVAASGGYYFAADADSIFATPNTITGSIGVFSIIPNMQKFFNNKLGITFDEVSTSPEADLYTINKPLTPAQRQFIQNGVDSTYEEFKQRVANGRAMNMAYVDSIGQGRIWSGGRAVGLGLVDRMGGLDEAVACAARLAKVTDYSLVELPEPKNFFELLFGGYKENARQSILREELGEDGIRTYKTIRRVKAMVGVTQARIPFDMTFE